MKPTSKITVGNRKVSEYSKTATKSEQGYPLVLSIMGVNFIIDFDYNDNVFLQGLKDIKLEVGNTNIKSISSIEQVEQLKLIKCLTLVLDAVKDCVINTKKLTINAEQATINAREQLILNSQELILGGDSKEAEGTFGPEEIVIKGKLGTWWGDKMDKFITLVENMRETFNTHTHPTTPAGPVTPPTQQMAGTDVGDVKNLDTLKTSTTTRTL